MKPKRHKVVVGIDEAGRGPLAGPVVACALTVQQFPISNSLAGGQLSNHSLKDSKKLNPRKREEVFEFLKQHPEVEWGIGRTSEKVIDRINIFQATKLAMARAVKNLEKKLNQQVDLLLIDGNFAIDLPHPQKSIVKGDEKVFLIKLASIIAKVQRDRAMARYDKQYPAYGFNKHKGYPTKLHREMLVKHRPCHLHRKSFKPVSKDY